MKKLFKYSPLTRSISAIILLTSLLLVGCLEGTDDSSGNFLGLSLGLSSQDIIIEGAPVKAEDVPWHMQSVVAATVLRLKGEQAKNIDGQFHIVGSGGIAHDGKTDLENFGVQNILINDFFHPEGLPDINRLGARLILVDPTGRRLGISFVADYELSESQVVLKGHAWEYIRPAVPIVETYIVPKQAFEALDDAAARDYTEFRSHILTNAVASGSSASSRDAADYAIVTFVMDRMQLDDKFELRISDVKEGPQGFTEDSRYVVHDNGWVTAVIVGKFSLAEDSAFWIKAVYAPKQEKGGFFELLNTEDVIGLYNSANLVSPDS